MIGARILLLTLLSFVFLVCASAGSIWRDIYGEAPKMNSIQVGSLVYHFLEPEKKLFYPYFTLTLKNSFVLNVFENTYGKLGIGIGIQRNWYQRDFSDGSGVRVGYMLGIIYGYCLKSSLKCSSDDKFPANLKIIPGFLIYGQYFFTKNIGISLSWAGVVFKSDLVYRW